MARIDTATGAATAIDPPTPRQGARRVWPDSKGRIWVSEWNAGKLGAYDPGTGKWREWVLPGESPQAYAVYVDETEDLMSDSGRMPRSIDRNGDLRSFRSRQGAPSASSRRKGGMGRRIGHGQARGDPFVR